MRSLIDITDFSVDELYELLDVASDIAEHPEKYQDSCQGKKLATLFYESSTRTRLSFEAARNEPFCHNANRRSSPQLNCQICQAHDK